MDRAIASLIAFVDQHPRGQLVVEHLERKHDSTAPDRLGAEAGVLDDHRSKLGRWRKPVKRRKRTARSSWDYFVAKYASLTWLVHEAFDGPTFLPGNVAGAGSALLMLGTEWSAGEILGPLIENAKLRGHGLDEAIVFHGGWGQAGFVLDTRTTSGAGEHPIYRFSMDEPLPGLPHESRLATVKVDKIVPFGIWLEREIARLIKLVGRELGKLERTPVASRPARATAFPSLAEIVKLAKLPEAALEGEWYRNERAREEWLTARWKPRRDVAFDGSEVLLSRLAEKHANVAKLIAADAKVARASERSSFRVLLTHDIKERQAFVAIEARGRLLRVNRIVTATFGFNHETVLVSATPAEAEVAGRALAAKLAPGFKPLIACKRTFVQVRSGRRVFEPVVTVRSGSVEVFTTATGARTRKAAGVAALARLVDSTLDAIAPSALLYAVSRS